ncbi:MAG: DUF624 domain-containing protein [Firmicutes bacterium]|nr:DUF624 domain-containing protein [Bacillota bacterium]
MAKLFDMDGPFIKYGTLLFDMVMLSAVWAVTGGFVPVMLLLSTGIFGYVPLIVTVLIIYAFVLHWLIATCSTMYSLGKKQRGTDTYTLRDFGHAFKLNYKQCMIISLIITTLVLLIAYNIWLIAYNKQSFGIMTYIIMPLELLVGLELIFVMLYIPNLVARFDMKTKDFIKYSFLMANKHLLTTLILIVLFAGTVYLCVFVNMGLIIVLPGLYMYIAAALLERVFKNYMPNEDEELENEEIEGFSLDAERQAIIDQYLNQSKFDDQGEYKIVKVDEEGKEIVEKDDYHIVKVDENGNEL